MLTALAGLLLHMYKHMPLGWAGTCSRGGVLGVLLLHVRWVGLRVGADLPGGGGACAPYFAEASGTSLRF